MAWWLLYFLQRQQPKNHEVKENLKMNLVRYRNQNPWNPFALARSLQDEIDRQFSRSVLNEEWENGIVPRVDVQEDAETIKVEAELPGLTKDDIEVRLIDNRLTIKGEKKEEQERKEGDFTIRERRFGSFHREFVLPATADASKIDAGITNGVLTVKIPKKEEAKPRQIEVKVK
jgi:HSP20 family protein